MNNGTQVSAVSGARNATFASMVCERNGRFKFVKDKTLSEHFGCLRVIFGILNQCIETQKIFGTKLKGELVESVFSSLKNDHDTDLKDLPASVKSTRETNDKIRQALETRIAYLHSDLEVIGRCQSGSGYGIMWGYGIDYRMNEIQAQLKPRISDKEPQLSTQKEDNDRELSFIVPDPEISNIIPTNLQDGLKILRDLVKLKEMMSLLSDKMATLKSNKLQVDIETNQFLVNYTSCKAHFDKIIEQIEKFEVVPSEATQDEGTNWQAAKKDLLEQIHARKVEVEANLKKINLKSEENDELKKMVSENAEEPEVQECLRFLENVVAFKEELVWIRKVKLLNANSQEELDQFYCKEFEKLQNVQNAFMAKKEALRVALTARLISAIGHKNTIDRADERLKALFSEFEKMTATSVEKAQPSPEKSWTSWWAT